MYSLYDKIVHNQSIKIRLKNILVRFGRDGFA